MDRGKMSEVLVFISANLEWDCSSLSLHAPLLRTGGREKNYIYIFRREKKEQWHIGNEIELTSHLFIVQTWQPFLRGRILKLIWVFV